VLRRARLRAVRFVVEAAVFFFGFGFGLEEELSAAG
jgi:hypothetical protein